MKILYLCTFYHSAYIFRNSMDFLEKRGHKILAFNAVAKGTIIDEKYKTIMDEKVVNRECFNTYDRYIYFKKQKKILDSVENNIFINDYDIIHSHTMFNGGWVARKIKKKYGVPYVITVRNTDLNCFFKIPFFKYIGEKILEDASGILFLSKAYRDQYKQLYVKRNVEEFDKKSYVIPNGLEPFWLENIYRPKIVVHTPIRILYVGNIDKNKNIEKIVESIKILKRVGYDARLTVIGQIINNSIYNKLRKIEFVTILPFLIKEKLIEYYRKSDIFVMVSYKESFGRVYAEAITQGTPIVYTKGQGFDGFFENGVLGYKVDPHNAEEVAKAIINIVKNYNKLSQQGINYCIQFSWECIAEKLDVFYREAIKY